ncbi:2OG-Fe(II) oxygenase [Eilatimonas milleporae]|uniref:Peroxiredoxin n=1 Tax=Eilatimonas milleporae TaxID=911205 RepID=A0A3M0CX87_9PROT|nr:2OG-Fe(II) oxygenase [Eilatimonas milleporae]RMB12129.1 peroxiredoxin [Eilatimonas milleporae]
MNKRLFVGDLAPDFTCPSTNNDNFHFNAAAGRYIVLCFFGSTSNAKNRNAVDFIAGDARHFFDDERISFFGVSIDPRDKAGDRVQQQTPGIRFFWDFDHAVSRRYNALKDDGMGGNGVIRYSPFTLILDPGLRIIAHIPLTDLERHNHRLVRVLSGLLPVDRYAGVPMTAPVLIIPNVFEPALCRRLVKLYETVGGRESGTMVEKDGYTVGRLDQGFKRRADCKIDDPALKAAMKRRIIRRIVPQVKSAFQFDVGVIERYIIACYDSKNQGFFRPHRDNTTKGTAHRKFACTINLNTGDYEGGALRFPEFGPRTYSAPMGGAVIFSCSLLHEATRVTRGKRYATLPFLYDRAGAQIRRDNHRFLSNAEGAVGRQAS